MDSRAQPSPPAAREAGLLVEEVGDETVVYDVETKEAHALSPIAAAVFAGSDGHRSLAELAAFASDRVGAPVTDDEVWDALVELERCNLLEPPTGGISRRGFVRAGVTIAASAPLVTSLAMPSIASAASCPVTKTCMTDADCAPGVTNGNCNMACDECMCIASGMTGFTGCTGMGAADCTGSVPAGQCGWN
jgi:hypothetical protein